MIKKNIEDAPEVQGGGGGGGESENWRDGGPNTVADKPPKSFIINDAHEDKTKVFFSGAKQPLQITLSIRPSVRLGICPS